VTAFSSISKAGMICPIPKEAVRLGICGPRNDKLTLMGRCPGLYCCRPSGGGWPGSEMHVRCKGNASHSKRCRANRRSGASRAALEFLCTRLSTSRIGSC
jgi:hypothetical protein